MTTANQGMSVEEIEQIVAQRVANAIEAIAIYELINQTKQQENKVTGNANNKRKWEGDHNGSFSQQQNKGHKNNVVIANGGVTKQEIVGSHFLKRNKGLYCQERKLKLPVMGVEVWDTTRVIVR
ncbi:hypothetical protein Tco_1043593 [Tanacetum coccineum]|uniref:Uncharacterized protein n=1 Tax=Tanacetum coccineum TaxID=301880 RepID=A0ABQ5GQ24_9ASTR